MWLSVKQVKQIYTLLQEYPSATLVEFRSGGVGWSIGLSDFVDYYEEGTGLLGKPKLLGTVEITDVKV